MATEHADIRAARARVQAAGWFPTPAGVVAELIGLACLSPGLAVLEPSAGEGAIASAVVAEGCVVDCVEVDEGRARVLKEHGWARMVTAGDFLTCEPDPVYHRVIMNPPFGSGAAPKHVLHAVRFLRPGGLLVSVMPAGITFRTGRDWQQVRDLAAVPGGLIDELPAGAFAEAGTEGATAVVVIAAPGPGLVPGTDGEPLRVTTDRTADGVPFFDPVTAPPGVYVRYDGWCGKDAVFRFGGRCIGCGARTWAHDHGGDDIRGPFGDHTSVPIFAEDLDGIAGDVTVPADLRLPRCALCWNEGDRYRKAIGRALDHLRATPAAPPPAAPPEPAGLATAGLW